MKKPTEADILIEVAQLRALRPVGQFKRKTAGMIQIAIDALQGNIDETSDEFNVEFDDEQRDMANQAIGWKEGLVADQPSTGWGALVE